MTDQQIDMWFWILVVFAGAIVAIALLCLAVFAFANWRRRFRDATALERIVVSTKYDG